MLSNFSFITSKAPHSFVTITYFPGFILHRLKYLVTFIMLLNNDIHNYTLFNLCSIGDKKIKAKNAVQDLKECLLNRGNVIGIDESDIADALEIWLKDSSNEVYCYHFFSYDAAIIEE